MKVIIDIPVELIIMCEQYSNSLLKCEVDELVYAINNGKKLSKDHGRLIDAEKLEKERIDYVLSGEAESVKDCTEFGMMLIKAPTIIEAKKEMCDGKK